MKQWKSIVVGTLLACVAVSTALAGQDTNDMASASGDASSARAVAKAQRKVNRRLGTDVRRALAKAGIDVSSVVVKTDAGAVTLIGAVPDNTQISRAESVAKSVAGVTTVANKLTVRPQM